MEITADEMKRKYRKNTMRDLMRSRRSILIVENYAAKSAAFMMLKITATKSWPYIFFPVKS
jgi:hypothetical protein